MCSSLLCKHVFAERNRRLRETPNCHALLIGHSQPGPMRVAAGASAPGAAGLPHAKLRSSATRHASLIGRQLPAMRTPFAKALGASSARPLRPRRARGPFRLVTRAAAGAAASTKWWAGNKELWIEPHTQEDFWKAVTEGPEPIVFVGAQWRLLAACRLV